MTASAAPTREIRALPSLTGLPPGCLAHPVPDDTAEPHLRQGEFAVIDATDRAPAHGELFLIAYGGPTAREACALRIVEVRSRPVRILVADAPAECVRWFAGPYRRPRTRGELHRWIEAGRTVVAAEGPFAPGQIERRLVGRVVGILTPDLEEPSRARAGRKGSA